MSSPSQFENFEHDEITIVLADDHPVVREGLSGMLSGQPDLLVVAKAKNGAEAVLLCETHLPDIVLMDLEMPIMNGITAIREICERQLPTRPIVLTTYESDRDIAAALSAGAFGYLLKDAPRADLFAAIRAVAAGHKIPPRRVNDASGGLLSEREIEVIELVAKGLSNAEIGRTLHISKATVKTHLIKIFRKLEASDRTSAVTNAIERKIIRI